MKPDLLGEAAMTLGRTDGTLLRLWAETGAVSGNSSRDRGRIADATRLARRARASPSTTCSAHHLLS